MLRTPEITVSTSVGSEVGYGGSSAVCDIAGGEELTALVRRAASVRERARGGGEMEGELTGVATVASGSSGKRRRRRI